MEVRRNLTKITSVEDRLTSIENELDGNAEKINELMISQNKHKEKIKELSAGHQQNLKANERLGRLNQIKSSFKSLQLLNDDLDSRMKVLEKNKVEQEKKSEKSQKAQGDKKRQARISEQFLSKVILGLKAAIEKRRKEMGSFKESAGRNMQGMKEDKKARLYFSILLQKTFNARGWINFSFY